MYKKYFQGGNSNNLQRIPRQTLHSQKRRKLASNAEEQFHGRNLQIQEIPDHQHADQQVEESNSSLQHESGVSTSFGPTLDTESSESESEEEPNVNSDIEDDDQRLTQNEQQYIYPGSPVTHKESGLLIFSYILRHGLSNAAVDDLLQLINVLLPVGSAVPKSTHQLRRTINCDYTQAQTNFYCSSCEQALDSEMYCTICQQSHRKGELLAANRFFVTFSVSDIIKSKLSEFDIGDCVQRNRRARQCIKNVESLWDITDGLAYKSLRLQPNDLSCSVNTDGVPAFKSSNCSIYPLLISINEVSYTLRRQHTMVVGLWFGAGKPNFDVFLDPFVKEAKLLSAEGISWSWAGKLIKSRIFFPIFVADSVARCVVQGINQFNGEFGCPWCLEKGEMLKLPNGKCKRIYPPIRRTNIIRRTHLDFLEHLKELCNMLKGKKKITHFGIKSASSLLKIPKFDIIKGFTFDYMHTCLLGVARRLSELWFDSKNHLSEYYLGKMIKQIDQELIGIKCPTEIPRAIRSLSHRRFWKSSEWKIWLLVAPSILNSYLPTKYFKHFLLFSQSIFTLCSAPITLSEIDKAEKQLFRFVTNLPVLYGKTNCSSNSHLLLHAAECVRNWGPLFCYSAFQFENFNQVILNSFSGSRLVAKQIGNKICERLSVQKLSASETFSNMGLRFFKTQIYSKKISKKHEIVGLVVGIGSTKLVKLQVQLIDKARAFGHYSEFVKSYSKCIIGGFVFDTKETTKRRNNIIQSNGIIYVLQNIYLLECEQQTQFFGVVNRLDFSLVFKTIYKINTVRANQSLLRLEQVDHIKFLCKKGENDSGNYIIKLPNYVEVE